jgi:hypothetical protein
VLPNPRKYPPKVEKKKSHRSITLPARSGFKRPCPRAEGIGGVIGREHDNAHAIISVKEIIGSDQVALEWNRKGVAPEFRFRRLKPAVCSWLRVCRATCVLLRYEFDDGDRAV